MNINTVNISFRRDLLSQIDRIAAEESRSRSELIREAARMYIERKQKWKSIFTYGKKRGSRLRLAEANVFEGIREYREKRREGK